LSIKHIKAELAKAIKTEWQLQWSSSSKGRAVHELCRHVCSQRIQGNYFLTKSSLAMEHWHRTSISFQLSPICSCGKKIEDRAHIIFKCRIMDPEIRGKYFPKNFASRTLLQLLST
ncbi:hypothetical protein CEXT_404611, partial [Caerostris extrusa]